MGRPTGKHWAFTLISALILAACSSAPQDSPENRRPNIIILLADDLGYGDLGVQGARDVETPRIDRLAREGVRLTDFYANHPVCAPSRAALMTGKYQHRFGFENNPGLDERASPQFGIPLTERTLPERLKELGYATGMVGKWHLGFTPEKSPTARGFDSFYGFLGGAMAYTPAGPTGAKTLLRGTQPAPMPSHTTEAFAAEAISFIETNRHRPFFLYVPFNAVHAPMQSTQAYMERFAGEKDAKRRAHLAMLAALDDAVGAILDTVDRNGLAEETLIVFISDNGGPTWQTTSSNGPLNGVKALVLEGGIRVPAIFRWKGAIPAGRVVSSAAIEFDVTATTLGVAGASDDPNLDGRNLLPFLRGEKAGDVHAQLYWRSGEQGAMRKGPWKLITIDDAHYLFDLRKDVSERKNLVSEQPAKLNELLADWNTWSKSMMAPLWGRNNATENDSARTTELKDLLDRYVKGLPVAPEKLLYGGGPE